MLGFEDERIEYENKWEHKVTEGSGAVGSLGRGVREWVRGLGVITSRLDQRTQVDA